MAQLKSISSVAVHMARKRMSRSFPEVESDDLHLRQSQAAAAIEIRPWVKAHTVIVKHALKRFGVTEREDRDDLTQHVFLSAYRALVRGEQIENPRAWLWEYARRHASNYRHKASRRSQYTGGDLLVYGKDPEQIMSDRETLKKALAVLTEDARDLLLDIRFEGVSWKKAAKERGITVEQARWIYRGAISRLKKSIESIACLRKRNAFEERQASSVRANRVSASNGK